MALPIADDPTNAIRDRAIECVNLFKRVEKNYDESLLSRKITPQVLFPDGKAESSLPDDEAEPSLPNSQKEPCLPDGEEEPSFFTFFSTYNDFDAWTYFNGVLSPQPTSLDYQTEGSDGYAKLVFRCLGTITKALAFIDKTSGALSAVPTPEFIRRLEVGITNAHIAVDKLYDIAYDLRQLHQMNVQRRKTQLSSNFAKEDWVFQDYITSVVRHRFPDTKPRLHLQLGRSIAIRRRRILNKSLRARRTTTASSSRGGLAAGKHDARQERPPDAPLDHGLVIGERAPRHSEGPVSWMSKALRPDTRYKRFKSVNQPKTQALPPLVSNLRFSKDDCFEYPSIPVTAEGQTRVQCPFCSDEVDLGTDASKAWKDHMQKDLTPYPCLVHGCAEVLTFFETRTEWKAHMETRHYSDWIRTFAPEWYCRIDHDQLQTFPSEERWRAHMTNLDNHDPTRGRPTEAQLDQLANSMNQMAPSNEFICPFCNRVPETVEQILQGDNDSSTIANNLLLDHIADHLESLSLKALPSLQHPALNTWTHGQQSSISRLPSKTKLSSTSYEMTSLIDQRLPFSKDCPVCKRSAEEGTIPLQILQHFVPLMKMSSPVCPSCGHNGKWAFPPLNRDNPSSIAYNRPSPTTEDTDRGCSDLWTSWQMRCQISRNSRMDPILMRLIHSADVKVRLSSSRAPDPEAIRPEDLRPEHFPPEYAFGARYQDSPPSFFMPYSKEEEAGGGTYSSHASFRRVSFTDSAKMESLALAIGKGDEEAFFRLLDRDQDIHERSIDSVKSMLDLAVDGGKWPVIESLLLQDAARLQPDALQSSSQLFEEMSDEEAAKIVL
ncbi:unnamed protein product [Clonostachys rosea]|uniref:C2H2-type domain-containing protein n=1 Tax=Bionectria ochroleuca TaxID=29856 RepID=A0ABY6U8H0_BIOOC|nr:unnamed protein product [Clonostachys rosea]